MLAKVDFFYNFWGEILSQGINLEARDFFDIFIIAFLVYAAIRLIQETHSVSVVVGLLILLGFYGIALIFDLPLTSLVLRSFFGAFLIIVAIIFQRELRRFFSAFGFLGISRRRFAPATEEIIEIVSRAAGRLAKDKNGALIIFPGREAVERHLEGGYRLNGEISEPLFLSIFDKTSPGHDGAVLIEGDKIKKFSVHMPLAEHVGQARRFGLRHRAALGLAERSDALVVAVSEERGIISIAQKGKLTQLGGEDELKKKLNEFYAEKFPGLDFSKFMKWLTKNTILLAVSFAVAFGLFLLVNSRFVLVQRNFSVSPEFKNIPPEITINDIVPQEVVLTLQGRGTDFDNLKPEAARIAVDVEGVKNIAKPGWHRVAIDKSNVELPFKLSVIKIDPAAIDIQIQKKIAPK